jgi:hypothetical protein
LRPSGIEQTQSPPPCTIGAQYDLGIVSLKGLAMSAVMIRCPVTGHDVSTGIEVEPNTLYHLPNVNARMTCPACGSDHVWTKQEAWLAETPRKASPD